MLSSSPTGEAIEEEDAVACGVEGGTPRNEASKEDIMLVRLDVREFFLAWQIKREREFE